MRQQDAIAGDTDYSALGDAYRRHRQPEPAIASLIAEALGDARTILNVGAGIGSYEPINRLVTPVEPSAAMRARRPEHLAPAVNAVAEKLPFPNRHFDATTAIFTIHQWADVRAGLRELRRVTRGKVIVLTCDPGKVQTFWLNAYVPEVLAAEARRYPPIETIAAGLATPVEVVPVPIPLACRDGFIEAYYGRPEKLLDPDVRSACSAWSFVEPAIVDAGIDRLRHDLESGAWDERFGSLRRQAEYQGSLFLMISHGRP